MGSTRSWRNGLDVASSIVLVMVAAVTVWRMAFDSPVATSEPQVEDAQGVIEASQITNVQGSGPLAVVEFSDFECPYCGEHARTGHPELVRRFVDSGRARYVAMNFPLSGSYSQAMKAAEAAECAALQGRFWDMRARLFAKPDQVSPDEISAHVRLIGVDVTAFDHCLNDRLTLVKIRADMSTGRLLGVHGTPAFYLGTVRNDGAIVIQKSIPGALYSLDAVESALDALVTAVAVERR